MSETIFEKGKWYALKDQPNRKGRAVSILKRTVCLAMNGNDEDRQAFPREQLQPITPPGHCMPGVPIYGGKP